MNIFILGISNSLSDPSEHQDTLEFYQDIEGVTNDMYQDLEIKEYLKLHQKAAHAYQNEEYHESIKLFKEALEEYYLEMEACRGLCEQPYDFGPEYPR